MTICVRCEAVLVPDNANLDTRYQYDNCLWIGFHGGYGMFVDNLDATMPNNTDERWLKDEDGEYLMAPSGVRAGSGPLEDLVKWTEEPLVNHAWEPKYNEERILPGPPDYEAVLCHECAHTLCEWHPWLAKLLNPHNSHAHKQRYHDEHPNHRGWDYETRNAP